MSFLKRTAISLTCLITFVAVSYLFSSCVNSKKISYFNYIPDSIYNRTYDVNLAQYTDPKIQRSDLLQVFVQTLDPQTGILMGAQATTAYTVQAQGGGMASNMQAIQGYVVDKNGEIELPVIGRINLEGLTTSEARDIIAKKAAQYYKNPVVNVRFANLNITILGEVGRPGQYTLPNEKVTILDLIGISGDLTLYGRRDNVLLIREENGKKKFVRFDLNSRDLFTSPYFYLRQHDVVYVQPTRNRAVATDVITTRVLTISTAVVSIVAIVLSRVNF